jgi:pSer/pThr/pTyr-binding forkhead associated (FHA) protein
MDEPDLNPKAPPSKQSVFLIVNRQMIPLEKPVIRIGRQLENDIVFHEEFVSRFHAEIRFEEGRYILLDRESTVGTFVNGRKIDRCILNSGDLITIANVQMMFVNNDTHLLDRARGMTRNLHGG